MTDRLELMTVLHVIVLHTYVTTSLVTQQAVKLVAHA